MVILRYNNSLRALLNQKKSHNTSKCKTLLLAPLIILVCFSDFCATAAASTVAERRWST